MRKFSYDKDFIRDVYPTLKSLGFTKDEITEYYNELYAEEARRDYYHRRHCVNYETGLIIMEKKKKKQPDSERDPFDDLDAGEELFESLMDDTFDPTNYSSNSSGIFEIYHSLTRRQKEIVRYRFANCSQTQIAAWYGVSPSAINRQIKGIQKHFTSYCAENHLIRE